MTWFRRRYGIADYGAPSSVLIIIMSRGPCSLLNSASNSSESSSKFPRGGLDPCPGRSAQILGTLLRARVPPLCVARALDSHGE
jgi:hypothetical protein